MLPASLLALSLMFTACGSGTGTTDGGSADVELATNTSTSAEEVATAFMDALTTDGWATAQAYVAPDYRSDEQLLSSWNNPDFEIASYTEVSASAPYQGKTSVSFDTSGTWLGSDYSATSGLQAAEIDGVWWVVPYAYTPAE